MGVKQVVLVVDDDKHVAHVAEVILRQAGYVPLVALGSSDALNIARRFEGEIHLLLTDVMMPDMDGPSLAEHILRERPRTRVLLM